MSKTTMSLAAASRSRDNNFHLIRIVAALAVLVTHGFALVYGTGAAEPFRDSLGMTLGSMAVDIFFITSGFLVTASLLSRQSAIEFIWARVLRIFPALLVMLLLTVAVLGPLVTSLSVRAYAVHPTVYSYFVKCATPFLEVAYKLPGVFDSNPYADAVNGSLWTLTQETRLYGILLLMWLSAAIVPALRKFSFKLMMVGTAGALLCYVAVRYFRVSAESGPSEMWLMFFCGGAFYVLRRFIDLSARGFWLCAVALATSAFYKPAFFLVYIVTLPYLLFYLAYVPAGFVRHYNKLGDYSYGVYIYAFPVQQTVVSLFPGIGVFEMILVSGTVSVALGWASWNLIESRVMRIKNVCVSHTFALFKRPLVSGARTIS